MFRIKNILNHLMKHEGFDIKSYREILTARLSLKSIFRNLIKLISKNRYMKLRTSNANATLLFGITVLFCATVANAQPNSKPDFEQLDLAIRDTTVVDVLKKEVVSHQTIGIKAGRIVVITNSSEAVHARNEINASDYLALPGFVNTHTHLWQHICKTCYPKEKLQQWIRVYQRIHYLEPDELYKVVLAASSEALLSGITTVSDYASLSFNEYGFETNANAARDAGLGGVLVWSNPSVFLPDRIKLKEIQRLRGLYKDHFDIWMGFGGLSFYSLPQVYSGIRIGQKLDMGMTEHTMENIEEQRQLYRSISGYYETYKDKLGSRDRTMLATVLAMNRPASVDAIDQLRRVAEQALAVDATQSPPKLTEDEKRFLQQFKHQRIISPFPVLDYFKVLPNYLAIHSVWPQREDIELMRRNNVSVSLNPESNMYLASGIAPIYSYLNSGILLTLGTDGAASNDAINSFSAMREMWNVYKIDLMNTDVSRNFDEWNILQAATINGARALMLDNRTGSLTVGKEADIVLVSKNELGVSPARPGTIIPLLIYSAGPRNVKYVISDGQVVVQNGSLVKYREEELASALSRLAIDVDQRVTTRGKIWRDEYQLREIDEQWYRFRSIRKLDTVDLKIGNTGSSTLKVTIMVSGVTFGGGSCYVTDEEVRKRFPEDCPKGSFKKEIVIKPHESIQIVKPPNEWEIKITTPSTLLRTTSDSGQLLVLVENSMTPR